MGQHVYFPTDLIRKKVLAPAYLVGYNIENVYIIIQTCSTKPTKLPQNLLIIGSINMFVHTLQFSYGVGDRYPLLSDDKYTVILFNPPNFRNLEYFSISPILLQSTGSEASTPSPNVVVEKLNEYDMAGDGHSYSISDESVLDKINQCLKIRNSFDKNTEKSPRKAQTYRVMAYVKDKMVDALLLLVVLFQNITILLINCINYKLGSAYALTDVLEVFKQLDLRLRQINYFPTQFLCYYDKSILYDTNLKYLKQLGIPFLNSSLNINNSNYINVYNSLWLIINDMLLGATLYKYLIENYLVLLETSVSFIDKVLFTDLYDLIGWVSFDHPAGFKLNTELGSFMGELFLWTLKFWKFIVSTLELTPTKPLAELIHSQNLIFTNPKVSQFVLKILCYGGLSLVLSFAMDYMRVITFHIYCFYYTLAKIYNRQIETMKSLFQLFRGRKYNVLRQRIDSIDSNDSFELDQMLLGTLLFIILIYLFPTIFAFYLMFSLVQITILMTLNLIETIVCFLNFTPLFVLLLKFKNSSRLQGGITFSYLGTYLGTHYVSLTNKSLTYNEILKNFFIIIKKNNMRELQVLQKFTTGHLFQLHGFKLLKFNYLMLPKNYERVNDVWKTL